MPLYDIALPAVGMAGLDQRCCLLCGVRESVTLRGTKRSLIFLPRFRFCASISFRNGGVVCLRWKFVSFFLLYPTHSYVVERGGPCARKAIANSCHPRGGDSHDDCSSHSESSLVYLGQASGFKGFNRVAKHARAIADVQAPVLKRVGCWR
jgi:hypothetical protein